MGIGEFWRREVGEEGVVYSLFYLVVFVVVLFYDWFVERLLWGFEWRRVSSRRVVFVLDCF